MSRHIRMILSMAIYLTGFIAAFYVGGWLMIFQPVKHTITAYTLGTLTLPQFMIAAIKCICSLTVAGLVWCIGYIVSNHIYDSRDE